MKDIKKVANKTIPKESISVETSKKTHKTYVTWAHVVGEEK